MAHKTHSSGPRAPLLKAAIASVTDQPVRYVVYGHDHADHISGGAVFADTAQFVSQQNAVPKIVARGDESTPIPTVIFDESLTLELGGKQVDRSIGWSEFARCPPL